MESDPTSFYWYDLETSGTHYAKDRIVQFAGVRTDLDLEPLEEPFVTYVQMGPDVMPSVEASLVTGITPQKTAADGVDEWQAISEINRRFEQPGTCVVGYNNLRFDDEFIRHTLFRNLLDPYAREWRDGNSRWDVIDVVRAAGALRPDGVDWPADESGKPTFALEAMTKANALTHEDAHEALSDVWATIGVARLIKTNQPRLWRYALDNRFKANARRLLTPIGRNCCVHVSRMYPNERRCLAPVVSVGAHPTIETRIVVADLSRDIDLLVSGTVEEIRYSLFTPRAELDEGFERVPLKEVRLNKCPFLAPLPVLRDEDAHRLGIDLNAVNDARNRLAACPDLAARIAAVYEREPLDVSRDAQESLYDGFTPDGDRDQCRVLQGALQRNEAWPELAFEDQRVAELERRLKARLRPLEMSVDEWRAYFAWIRARLTASDRTLDTFRSEIQAKVQDVGDNDVLRGLWAHADAIEGMLREGEARFG